MNRAAFLLIFFSLQAQASLESIVASMPERMATARVPGLVLVVIKDNGVVYSQAFGVRELGADDPLQVDDVFEAASNGKMMAAYRLMMLVERGELSLQDEISDPRIRSDCGLPTLEAVLSHTAGLGNNILADEFVVDCHMKGSFSYSGEGYLALESVFRDATGRASADDLEDNLFHPLGMLSSSMGETNRDIVPGHPDLLFALIVGRATDHQLMLTLLSAGLGLVLFVLLTQWLWRSTQWWVAIPSAVSGFIAIVIMLAVLAGITRVAVPSGNRANDIASTLKTSAPDLAGFAMELMNPTLVSESLRDQMLTPIVPVNERVKWAPGIGVDESNGRTTYWHWGSNPGYQSLFVIEPETGNGVVILTNGGGFADFFVEGWGGYDLSRDIARGILSVDGHWSTQPP